MWHLCALQKRVGIEASPGIQNGTDIAAETSGFAY